MDSHPMPLLSVGGVERGVVPDLRSGTTPSFCGARLRTWARAARAIAAVMIALGTAAVGRCAEPTVKVEPDANGDEIIAADFIVDASSRTAWDVLTDYAHLPSFVSSMKSSRVVQRNPDGLVVEQTALGRFFLFAKSMRVLLKIRESPWSSVTFEDISQRDFDLYRGEWTLFPEAQGTRVMYTLCVREHVGAPRFVKTRAMAATVAQLLAQVRDEMRRRSAAS